LLSTYTKENKKIKVIAAENTVRLFFHCCQHDWLSDRLATAVVYRDIAQQNMIV
jgi:hypothetical protein